MKKVISFIFLLSMSFILTSCTNENLNEDFSVAMVTDVGGINDQSFNTSAWEGLKQLSNDKGIKVNYLESKQSTDYVTNLDSFADQGYNLIWAIGFSMSDAVLNAAAANLDINYAIADNSYGDDTPSNVTGVMFVSEQSSFLVGYIAGKTTKTNKVGFVGGISSSIIDQFEYGYRAGVDYAAKELGKDIKTSIQYIESFNDATKGKATASKMISDGCDIIFHAAGGAGVGVIEAAKEANKYAIGADRDQAYLAPNNVLTSALKKVDKAVILVTNDAINGNKIGGKTVTYGLKEDCVGIPESNPNMDHKVYEDALKIQDKIIDGEIIPPGNESEYLKYLYFL